jgi:hypothetical protein
MQSHVALFDDFTGYDSNADIWNESYSLGVTSDASITEELDADDLGGTLTVQAGSSTNNYQQVDMLASKQFRLPRGPVFEARFKLAETTNIKVMLGFTVDNRANAFGVHASSVNGDFRIYSRVASSDVVDTAFSTPVVLDTAWHTVKVAVDKDTGDADIYFDGVLGGTIAFANLPFDDVSPCIYIQTLTGATKVVYVDWVSVIQPRAPMSYYMGDAADANINCLGDVGNALLVGMGSTGTDAGDAFVVFDDYSVTNLGHPIGATICHAGIIYYSEIYVGFNTATPDLYRWDGGTSWTAMSLSETVEDLCRWDDYLYIGTKEAAGRATVQRFDLPGFTDIGDPTWTNGATAVRLCVNKNKLYAYCLADNEVFEYDGAGTAWTSLGTPGGVTTSSTAIARYLISHKGNLYACGGATDSTLYRWDGGTTWTAVFTAADVMQRPVSFDGQIFVMDRDSATGDIMVYRSSDGVRFEAIDLFTPTTNANAITARAWGAVIAGLTSTDAKLWEVR